MSSRNIRIVIVLATIAIVGIAVMQVFWFRKAFDQQALQFNHTVNSSLKNVAESLLRYNESVIPEENPVVQQSSNYFTVQINDAIDANMLEFMLKSEFEKRQIKADFEYGIYDCNNEKMVYGNYVQLSETETAGKVASTLPVWDEDIYYFGVLFPKRTKSVLSQMEIWVFSTLLLLLVIMFFCYAVYVILKQKRLSEVQRDFVNNMTHEFKTPISTISIAADVLKKPEISQSQDRLKNYAEIIQVEARRLENQVERVLQMADLDSTSLKLKKEPLDVNGLISGIAAQLKPTLDKSKGKLSLALDETLPAISGDKMHLKNALYNLIDNAIKYAGEKAPEVTISTRKVKNAIQIQIKDGGIGISELQQKRIFDKFYRAPTGERHDVKGFGLGLHYVQLVARVHGGKVEIKSELGEGASFTLNLPII